MIQGNASINNNFSFITENFSFIQVRNLLTFLKNVISYSSYSFIFARVRASIRLNWSICIFPIPRNLHLMKYSTTVLDPCLRILSWNVNVEKQT